MPKAFDQTARTDNELLCPVPGCDYTHGSANGIISHVGNGHPNGWDDADGTARDVHIAATRRDEAAMRRVMKVEAYLARNGVDTTHVDVYVHQAYGSVQLAPTGGLEDMDPFMNAVRVDGIHYNGDVNWCTEEFVDELPPTDTDTGGNA